MSVRGNESVIRREWSRSGDGIGAKRLKQFGAAHNYYWPNKITEVQHPVALAHRLEWVFPASGTIATHMESEVRERWAWC